MSETEQTEQQEKQIILDGLIAEHPIEDLVQFTELDLHEKIGENTFMVVRYRDFYHKELSVIEELNDKFETLTGKRYDYYRFEYSKELSKVEIERYYLPKDEFILKMKKIIRKQNIRVNFFEMCWKAFEKQQWNLKLFKETL